MKDLLDNRLVIPAIGAPMFIVSGPELVIAQCKAGIVGSFPALNARPASMLDEWIARIREELAAHDAANPDRLAAPFAVNQIVHRSNDRLDHDMAVCEKHKVPIVITSLGARPEVNQAVQGWGGVTLHDVINLRFAHKAIEKGATGLIAVAAGAGGHARDALALRADQRDPCLLRRTARAFRRHCHRGRYPRSGDDGRRFRLYRLPLHRHARGQCGRCLQADDR